MPTLDKPLAAATGILSTGAVAAAPKIAIVGPGHVGVALSAGISDVCLSVPSVVGRTGVQRVLSVPLSEDERAGLQHSARTVRAVIDKLGL